MTTILSVKVAREADGGAGHGGWEFMEGVAGSCEGMRGRPFSRSPPSWSSESDWPCCLQGTVWWWDYCWGRANERTWLRWGSKKRDCFVNGLCSQILLKEKMYKCSLWPLWEKLPQRKPLGRQDRHRTKRPRMHYEMKMGGDMIPSSSQWRHLRPWGVWLRGPQNGSRCGRKSLSSWASDIFHDQRTLSPIISVFVK